MTAPRIIVAGATTAITRRTTMRKAFFAPWHPLVQEIVLYALADAQHKTGVAVHHAVTVLNHIHLVVTPTSDNLPDFTRRFHHDVSCALNVLLARERYDSPHELFDGRSANYMRLLDAEAQATRLNYDRHNWVAAGLVARPEHMPGRQLGFDLWKRGHLDVRRPDCYFSENRAEVHRLRITPPPLLLEDFDGDVNRLVYQMNTLGETTIDAMRCVRTRSVIGVKKLARLHPWSEPRSLRESGGRQLPTFRVGARTRGINLPEMAAALETRAFRREHGEAWVSRRGGDLDAEFPYGTYLMRVVHKVKVKGEPREDALVTRPGIIDVARGKVRVPFDALAPSIRAANAAVADEAALYCEENEVTLDEVTSEARAARTADDDKKRVHTQHRFAKNAGFDLTDARRVVVLRDRRMGRPKAAGPRRGSDPPG